MSQKKAKMNRKIVVVPKVTEKVIEKTQHWKIEDPRDPRGGHRAHGLAPRARVPPWRTGPRIPFRCIYTRWLQCSDKHCTRQQMHVGAQTHSGVQTWNYSNDWGLNAVLQQHLRWLDVVLQQR